MAMCTAWLVVGTSSCAAAENLPEDGDILSNRFEYILQQQRQTGAESSKEESKANKESNTAEKKTCQFPWVLSKPGNRCKCSRAGYVHTTGGGCIKLRKVAVPVKGPNRQEACKGDNCTAGDAPVTTAALPSQGVEARAEKSILPNSKQIETRPVLPHAQLQTPHIQVQAGDITEGPEAASIAASCLDHDLHELAVAAYGGAINAEICRLECLPKPAGMPPAELSNMAREHSIKWCEQCIKVGSYMSPEEIAKVEKETGEKLCITATINGYNNAAAPAPPRFTGSINPSRTAPIAELLQQKTTPAAIANARDIALIIANGDYLYMPPRHGAERDRAAIRAVLLARANYIPENIIIMDNASLDDFSRIFGAEGKDGVLAEKLRHNPDARLLIYYSGYAIAEAGGNAYLLAVDSKPESYRETGWSMTAFYQKLRKVPAKSAWLFMETGFGAKPAWNILPPNLPDHALSGLPASPVNRLNILIAASGGQMAIRGAEYGTGIFTRYLVEAISGAADQAPTGNGDGRVDTIEMYVYTAAKVRHMARKSFGLLQSPVFGSLFANPAITTLQ
jgi:hypothetical protein